MLSLSGSPLQGREACIAGRALRDGGAMKGGAAKSLGKNEERNRLPWQGKVAVPCVNRAGEAVVEKAGSRRWWLLGGSGHVFSLSGSVSRDP